MKSEDLQKAVALKHQNGDYPTKVFRDLNGVISLATIKRWYKMIDETGSINLSLSPGRPRTARKVIDWNKVTSKPKLIQELKRAVKKIRQNMSLKVVLLGPIDCIVCHRTVGII